MSVKAKLVMLLIVSIAGYALIFGADMAGRSLATEMSMLEKQASLAQMSVLQCRRQEKNFLHYLDKVHLLSFKEAFSQAKTSLNTIADKSEDIQENVDQANVLLDAYEKSFLRLAEITQEIGLTEKDGMRWQFISAARTMEAQFKNNADDDILVALLQLRRQEKNFIIRHTEKELNSVHSKMDILINFVNKIEVDEDTRMAMRASLDGYTTAFNDYAQARAESEAVTQELIRDARALEPVVESVRDYFALEQKRTAALVFKGLVAIEICTALAIILLSIWVILSITRPLASLTAYSEEVVGGNLDAVPLGSFQAEFDVLRNDISNMVTELKSRLSEVEVKGIEAREQADSAHEAMLEAKKQHEHAERLGNRIKASAARAETFTSRVTQSAEELTAMISQAKQGAVLQTERMQQTAAAIEQMNVAVLEVARNAGEASENARETKSKAENGAMLVKNAVMAISTVNGHTGNMRAGMENLEREVESIGVVMDVISEIADQTNLLALNAAIEAARAGDAGRGFAVVADEVRKLAEKTMDATREVGRNIEAIRNATGENIEYTREAVKAVEESTRLATETGASQEEILYLVDLNTLQVEGIASASEEQSVTSDQINVAVSEVHSIAEQSLDGMNNSFTAVQTLTSMAEELRTMIQHMLSDEVIEQEVDTESISA
ncbi:MAG: methyl-accepting chemotaxis protein [Pseudodesulfovibrio sp.]|nr:methyl-accepting chemotaxis protein [Pseudodesulfovibrio sp.]